MKKITLLTVALLSFIAVTQAQCTETVPLPYQENFDAAILPDLPDCTFSYRQTFVGNEWEVATAPNSSFTGNVVQYSTYSDAGWGMWCSYFMRPVQLTAGMVYKVSYKYAHSDDVDAIYALRTNLFSNNEQSEIALGTHEAISGTDVVNYSTELFTVPTTNSYYLRFDIESVGNEGILYLDDIKIEEMGIMATSATAMAQLMYYPNPAKDMLTITNDTPLQQLELFNTTGQLLTSEFPEKETATLNIENLPSGVYFLKVRSGGGSETIQVIKQ